MRDRIKRVFGHAGGRNQGSFIPEEVGKRKAELRTSIIATVLFFCVMFGVTAAFFVSNKELRDVRRYQAAINVRYAQAAKDLEQLKVLEAVEADLVQKAEVTTALYEKVPRSILMAEIVNRMPSKATLTEVELTSKRLDRPVRSGRSEAGNGNSIATRAERSRGEGETTGPVVTAPRFESHLSLIGVAPRHEDVAAYVAALQLCPLLIDVELIQAQAKLVEQTQMMEFRIEADLRPDADARQITPLESPRHATHIDPEGVGAGFDMDGMIRFMGAPGETAGDAAAEQFRQEKQP